MPTDLGLVFQVTLEDEIAVVIYFSQLERELPKFPTAPGSHGLLINGVLNS